MCGTRFGLGLKWAKKGGNGWRRVKRGGEGVLRCKRRCESDGGFRGLARTWSPSEEHEWCVCSEENAASYVVEKSCLGAVVMGNKDAYPFPW